MDHEVVVEVVTPGVAAEEMTETEDSARREDVEMGATVVAVAVHHLRPVTVIAIVVEEGAGEETPGHHVEVPIDAAPDG